MNISDWTVLQKSPTINFTTGHKFVSHNEVYSRDCKLVFGKCSAVGRGGKRRLANAARNLSPVNPDASL